MRMPDKKVLILCLLTVLIVNATTSYAQVMTFTKEYTYQASEVDSKLSCRAIALEQVKRLLLEQLGTYLESQTEVKNFQLTKDQITMLTAGIVSTEVEEEKWDGQSYWLRAQIVADPNEVSKSVDKLRSDRNESRELEESRRKAEEASREIKKLKSEIAALKGPVGARQLQKYNTAVMELSATDLYERGKIFLASGKYHDAIDAFTKAIELYPTFWRVYHSRSMAYTMLNIHPAAINDLNAVIEFDKENSGAYNNRGLQYSNISNYEQAIRDLEKAIALEPRNTIYLNNLGRIYYEIKNHKTALIIFTKAIEIDPDFAAFGSAYDGRGLVHMSLGNYRIAIKDFSKAISLSPNDGEAYFNRSLAYKKLNDDKKAMSDAVIADRLGHEKAQSFLKSQGLGW